MTKILCFE